MRLFQGFALAFNMLTIIPFFKVHNFFRGINGYSAMFYPVVGFILGSILYLIYILGVDYIPSTHLSVIIFAVWITLTGGLHLDGLSDMIDGLFVDKSKSLNVMKDAHIGSMAMIFTSIFLLLKLSSIIHLQEYYILPIILMLARLNASISIYFYNYISGGVGQLIKDELKLKYLIVSIIFSLFISYFFSSILLFILSFIVVLLICRFFTNRLGGCNGDIYGAIIEISELWLLNIVLVI